MKHPILYSFRRCPYAMRARMAIRASGIKVEIREIILRDKPAHMLEISPKGTVPILQLTDKTIIDESLDIMIYALGRQAPDEWLSGNEQSTNALITQNDTTFKNALDRYKYPDRYPDEDCSSAFANGIEILKDLNARIAKNGQLITDYPTLADIAIFPFIRQFANTDRNAFDALKLSALSKWLKNHIESALFTAVMEKYDPWKPDDAPVIFGD